MGKSLEEQRVLELKERNRMLLKMLFGNIDSDVKNILDVGCGDGTLSEIISRRLKVKVTALDISPALVQKAKEKGIEAYTIDVCAQPLPFENGKFDVIVMARTLEHLVDPDSAIREIKRVLKKEGLLFLSTPNLAAWYNRFLLLLGIQPIFTEVSSRKIFGRKIRTLGEKAPVVGHLRIFTLNALKAFMSYYEFEIKEVKGSCFLENFSVFGYLDRIFAIIPSLSSYNIIVAINKK
jgi:methionine biosynthesis protein MetW